MGASTRLCDHGDCTAPAVGLYEGTIPPADAFRYAACSGCAPHHPPIRFLREQLPTGPIEESDE